jgi:hypothetical protein
MSADSDVLRSLPDRQRLRSLRLFRRACDDNSAVDSRARPADASGIMNNPASLATIPF